MKLSAAMENYVEAALKILNASLKLAKEVLETLPASDPVRIEAASLLSSTFKPDFSTNKLLEIRRKVKAELDAERNSKQTESAAPNNGTPADE